MFFFCISFIAFFSNLKMSSTYFGSIITYKYKSKENEGETEREREGERERTRALRSTYFMHVHDTALVQPSMHAYQPISL